MASDPNGVHRLVAGYARDVTGRTWSCPSTCVAGATGPKLHGNYEDEAQALPDYDEPLATSIQDRTDLLNRL